VDVYGLIRSDDFKIIESSYLSLNI